MSTIWSEALFGYANVNDGLLIWGIDARPNQATGLDAVSGFSLVENPEQSKSNLIQQIAFATEPPVRGVEVRAIADPSENRRGFVHRDTERGTVALEPPSRVKMFALDCETLACRAQRPSSIAAADRGAKSNRCKRLRSNTLRENGQVAQLVEQRTEKPK